MEKLVEIITCKKCNTVEYVDIEILNKEPIRTSENVLVAIVIKTFKCKECNSIEVDRDFVKRQNDEVI